MPRKFNSEFDPDELAKITHRGLKRLERGMEPRVTQEERSTLKQQGQSAELATVKARRVLDALFGSLISAVQGLFAPKTKKVVQCQNYGHIIKPGWKGEFPVCKDCGAMITSPDEVRGAMPKRKDDDQSNSGRKYVK